MANNTNIYGTSYGSIPKPKATATAKEKPLTKTQQAELAKQEEEQYVATIRGGLEQLVQQPEFDGASVPRKRELIEQFNNTQWKPVMQDAFNRSEDLAAKLDAVKQEVVIGALRKAEQELTEGFWAKDAAINAWIGAKSATSYITDQLPATIAKEDINEATDYIDRSRGFLESYAEFGATPENQELKLYTTSHYIPQRYGLGYKYSKEELPALMQEAADFRLQEIKDKEKQISEGQKVLAENLAEREQVNKDIAEWREAKSGLSRDRDKRYAEIGEDAFAMTKSYADYGFWGAYYLATSDFAESAPALVGGAIATTAGTLVNPVVGVSIGAATVGVISGGQAGYGAFDMVLNMTEEQLAQAPEYQELLKQGYTPDTAKMVLALESANDSALYSGLINGGLAVVGGGVSNMALRGGVQLGTRGAGAVATNTASRGLGAKATSGVISIGKTAAWEGGTNALDALSLNYAIADNTGRTEGLWHGVGDAWLQGTLFGSAVKGTTTTVSSIRNRGSKTSAAEGIQGSKDGTLAAIDSLADATPEQRAAIEAAVSGGTGISPEGVATVSTTSEGYTGSVRRQVTNLNKKINSVLDKDNLSPQEVKDIHSTMDKAIEAGVDRDIVLAYEKRYGLLERADYIPYESAERTGEAPKRVKPRTLLDNEGDADGPGMIRNDIVYEYEVDPVTGETTLNAKGHVLNVGIPEWSKQAMPEFTEVNGVKVVKKRKQPVDETVEVATVDEAVTVDPDKKVTAPTVVKDEGVAGDPWYIANGVLYEAMNYDSNSGRITYYSEVGPVSEVGLPANSTQATTEGGSQYVGPNLPEGNPRDGELVGPDIPNRDDVGPPTPDGNPTSENFVGPQADDPGASVSPVTGEPVETVADMNREFIVIDYISANEAGVDAITAAREAVENNVPLSKTGKKWTKAAKERNLQERMTAIDQIVDALTFGMLQAYLANGGDLSIFKSAIDSIVPDNRLNGRDVYSEVNAKLAELVKQANEEAASLVIDMTNGIERISESANDSPENVSTARGILNTLLQSADTADAIARYKEDLSARMAAEPKNQAEVVQAQANQKRSNKQAKAKRQRSLRRQLQAKVDDFKSRAQYNRDGSLTDISFLQLMEEILPFFAANRDDFSFPAGALNSLEPNNRNTNSSLRVRAEKFLGGLYEASTARTNGERSNQVGHQINSLLETYTRRRVEQSAPEGASSTSGGNPAIDGGGTSRSTIEVSSTSQANEGLVGSTRPNDIGGQAVGGGRNQSNATTRGGKGTRKRGSGRGKREQSNNAGGYKNDRGKNKNVNEDKSVNLITGEFDTDTTPNGLSTKKTAEAVRSNLEKFGGSEAMEARVVAIEEIYRMIANKEIKGTANLVLAYRLIDQLTAELYAMGMPHLSSDLIVGPTHEQVMGFISRDLTAEERAVLREAAQQDTQSTSENAFVSEMTREAVVEAGGDAPSSRFAALSDIVKKIFRKIALSIAAGVIVFSSWTGITNVAEAGTIQHGATITAPLVSESIPSFSDRANATLKYVKESGDNKGKPYMIADKSSGMIHMMSPDHNLIASAPALYGKNMGDAPVVGQTPAGAFNINVVDAPAAYGGDVAQFSTTASGDIFSIHRMVNKRGQDRPTRLASADPEAKRISDGCINVPEQYYDAFIGQGGAERVYIVPDSNSIENTFSDGNYRNTAAEANTGTIYASPESQTIGGYKDSIINQTDPESTLIKEAFQTQPEEVLMKNKEVLNLDTTGNTLATGLASIMSSIASGALAMTFVIRGRGRKGAKGTKGSEASGRVEPTNAEIPTDFLATDPDVAQTVEQTSAEVSAEQAQVDEGGNIAPEQSPEGGVVFSPDEFDYVLGIDDVISTTEGTVGDESRASFVPLDSGDSPTAPVAPPASNIIVEPNDNGHLFTGTMADFDPRLVAPSRVGILDKVKIGVTSLFTGEFVAPFYDFLLSNVKTVQENIAQHPLIQAINRSENIRNSNLGRLTRRHLKPILSMGVELANEIGTTPKIATEALGAWATLAHIPEANAALRRELEHSLIQLRNALAEAPLSESGPISRAIADAQNKLNAFDNAQATGELSGDVRMAGGMTDSMARDRMAKLLNLGISIEQFQEAQAMINNSYKEMLAEASQRGLIDSHTAGTIERNGFQNYVPLYVAEIESAPKAGGRSVNLADVMVDREGGKNPPVNAVHAMARYMAAFSTSMAEADIAQVVNQMHNQFQEAGNKTLLTKVKMGENNDMGAGVTFYEQTKVGDQTVIERYMLKFTDANLNTALQGIVRERNGFQEIVSMATRGNARLVTAFTPVFPIINSVRETAERFGNTMFRHFKDDEGNRINSVRASLEMIANMRNPLALYQIGRALKDGVYEGKYGEAVRELSQAGGLSLYSEQVYLNNNSLNKELKRSAVGRGLKKVEKANMLWNDVPNALPSVAQYMALRNQGISVERAAGIVLETMNFSRRGKLTRKVDFAFPFLNSAFQSGASIANNLGLGVGQKFFSKNNARNLIKVGAVGMAFMFAAPKARESLGVDEDGNYIMDTMSMKALRAYIPFFNSESGKSEGDFMKAPIGFGMNQLLWTWSVMLDRVSRGVSTPEDFVAETAKTFLANAAVDTTPDYDLKDAPLSWLLYSGTPTVFQPIMQIASNRGYFGQQIVSANKHRLDKSSNASSGVAATPPAYTSIAETIKEYTGLDFYPEQVRTAMEGYLIGPLSYITKSLEHQGAYYNKIKRVHDIDPLMYALGMNRLVGNTNNLYASSYHRATTNMADKLEALGISWVDKNYDPKNQEKRYERMAREARAAGLTTDQIADVIRMAQSAKKFDDVGQAVKTKVKRYQAVNGELSDEIIEKLYAEANDEAMKAMRMFMRSYDPRRWQ